MKNEKVTIDVIKAIGFETWTEFYLASGDCTPDARKGTAYYEYMKDNKTESVTLPLQPDALASLAYYESLDMIKPFAASFGALEISGEVYKTEYVTRDKDGRFEVCKFKIASRNVFKLIALENGILLKLAETVKKD